MAAKPKSGYILRSDIRRVACPTCGVQPGAFCTTFDKREHPERTTAALARKPDPAETQQDPPEKTSPDTPQPAKLAAVCPPPAPEPVGIRDIDESEQTEQTFKDAVNAQPLKVQKQAFVGERVRLCVTHGPTTIFNHEGVLTALNYGQRRAELMTDDATFGVQWGAQDYVEIEQAVE